MTVSIACRHYFGLAQDEADRPVQGILVLTIAQSCSSSRTETGHDLEIIIWAN